MDENWTTNEFGRIITERRAGAAESRQPPQLLVHLYIGVERRLDARLPAARYESSNKCEHEKFKIWGFLPGPIKRHRKSHLGINMGENQAPKIEISVNKKFPRRPVDEEGVQKPVHWVQRSTNSLIFALKICTLEKYLGKIQINTSIKRYIVRRMKRLF